MNRQHKTTRPIIKAAPAIDPITMPAIAPPESPLPPPEPEPELEDGVLVAVDVEVGSVIVDVMEGSTTPAHRVSASEL